MNDPYHVLGVAHDADDDTIRRRYLELVREFPPERHPDRFARIRAAYERLKDLDARVRHRLFEQGKRDGIEELIEETACRTPRRRIGLQALLHMQKPR
ncbi:MAG TPA: J domain-containing protein [Gemmataceae bacterium]|jgi:curved DNA-binding protein CbpA|nr:J domain-containing protein [Gemmataceae bacterium]